MKRKNRRRFEREEKKLKLENELKILDFDLIKEENDQLKKKIEDLEKEKENFISENLKMKGKFGIKRKSIYPTI